MKLWVCTCGKEFPSYLALLKHRKKCKAYQTAFKKYEKYFKRIFGG